MAENSYTTLTDLSVVVEGVDENLLTEMSMVEVNLSESLLNPGLQARIVVQSNRIVPVADAAGFKVLTDFYGRRVRIRAERPCLEPVADSLPNKKTTFDTTLVIYRMSNRRNVSHAVEQFELHACDLTLIQDAQTWVSKSWAATAPSKIVEDVLSNCIKAPSFEIEESAPKRDYIAGNIHPFQVVYQQAEVSLNTAVFDPSFVHYMTFQNRAGEDIPTHNFKSLTSLALLSEGEPFAFNWRPKVSTEANYANPDEIMEFFFPCDFDLISDMLNGKDVDGKDIFSLITFNPYDANAAIYGKGLTACGGTSASSITNLGTAERQDSVPTDVERHLLKRKPRMTLLDQDKVALQMTVPFAPFLNVGRVIRVNFPNENTGEPGFGSGNYLISTMTHTIRLGGFAFTVLQCVADTVATGKV